ncbi:hypothetical protein [Enterococcus rotai]|uniref:hypothetical protein n=1 Tax=Enterococcus rotai TaxID=118060 RepID=UPI0035C7679A
MKEYLWVYILGAIAMISFLWFVITLSRDIFLVKKLKVKKMNFILNFSLMLVSLTSVGLIIYLFALLKEQIKVLS